MRIEVLSFPVFTLGPSKLLDETLSLTVWTVSLSLPEQRVSLDMNLLDKGLVSVLPDVSSKTQ